MPVCSREGERHGLGNAADLYAHTDSVVAVGQYGYGETALHYAAIYNRLEMAELLLGAGASVDANDKVRAGCSCLGGVC